MTRQRWQSFAIATYAFLVMLPGTLCAPVLREFVRDVYPVGDDGVAWFLSIGMLGSFVAAPFAGLWSDRIGRRRVLIVTGALANALCWALMPYAPNFLLALGIRLIEGVSSVFVIGIFLASVADTEYERSGKSGGGMLYGWVGMLLMLGAGAGLALGGWLGTNAPLRPFHAASVLMLFNALFAVLCLRETRPSHHGVSTGEAVGATSLTELWPALRVAPLLLIPLGFAFADRFCVGYLLSSLNLRMRDDLVFSPALAGAILGLIMILMSVLSLPAAALARSGLVKDGTARLVAGGSLLYGLGLAATGFAGDRDGMILAALLTGLGAGLMHAPTLMLVARLAPATLTAICMSAYVGLGSLGNLLGPLASRRLETALLSLTGDSELAFVLLAAVFGSIEVSLAVALLLAILFSRYYRRGPADALTQINETAREMPNSPRPPGVLSE